MFDKSYDLPVISVFQLSLCFVCLHVATFFLDNYLNSVRHSENFAYTVIEGWGYSASIISV